MRPNVGRPPPDGRDLKAVGCQMYAERWLSYDSECLLWSTKVEKLPFQPIDANVRDAPLIRVESSPAARRLATAFDRDDRRNLFLDQRLERLECAIAMVAFDREQIGDLGHR